MPLPRRPRASPPPRYTAAAATPQTVCARTFCGGRRQWPLPCPPARHAPRGLCARHEQRACRPPPPTGCFPLSKSFLLVLFSFFSLSFATRRDGAAAAHGGRRARGRAGGAGSARPCTCAPPAMAACGPPYRLRRPRHPPRRGRRRTLKSCSQR